MTKISVIIKALNEEKNITRAIESSLAAVEPFGGEVILADSASTDRTIEIAKRYPIKIVQLENPAERCCGVGPQLGFQHSEGEYVYILDGDMELSKEFIALAISRLDQDPELAGACGFIDEKNASNFEFRGRMKRLHEQRVRADKDVVCLGGGGLYRRASLESVGYMSDRNLHGYEEYDLGVRLQGQGWRLLSMPEQSANHYSYSLGTMQMLWHRLKGGSFFSQGEMLRASIGSGYWPRPVREIRIVRYLIGVWAYWIAALAIIIIAQNVWLGWAAVLAGPLVLWAVLAYRHKSIWHGLYGTLVWHISAIGTLIGFLRSRKSPEARIASRVLSAC